MSSLEYYEMLSSWSAFQRWLSPFFHFSKNWNVGDWGFIIILLIIAAIASIVVNATNEGSRWVLGGKRVTKQRYLRDEHRGDEILSYTTGMAIFVLVILILGRNQRKSKIIFSPNRPKRSSCVFASYVFYEGLGRMLLLDGFAMSPFACLLYAICFPYICDRGTPASPRTQSTRLATPWTP